MSGEELILERLNLLEEKLTRLEERLETLARPWDTVADLGHDLGLLVNPAVRLLTAELAEVETGFRLEDILTLMKRLLLSFHHLTWALEQLENLIDWWNDMELLLKIAVPHLIDKLDNLNSMVFFRSIEQPWKCMSNWRKTTVPRTFQPSPTALSGCMALSASWPNRRLFSSWKAWWSCPVRLTWQAPNHRPSGLNLSPVESGQPPRVVTPIGTHQGVGAPPPGPSAL